jgi:flagellar assembly protein FliH
MNAPAGDEPVSRWDMTLVSGKTIQGRRPGRTVSDLEEEERKMHREAMAKGREEGLAAARAESQKLLEQLKSQVARLESVIGTFAQPLREMDSQVEDQLVNLAMMIARQLVRRELKTDPAQVIAVIRETVGLLPASARDVRVHLHPEDANVIRERLAMPGSDRAWTIVEDPVMTRGGCRVTTDTAQIDARLETRINALMTAMLGDERAASRGSEG